MTTPTSSTGTTPATDARAKKRRELRALKRQLIAAGIYSDNTLREDSRTHLAEITLRPRDLVVIEFIAKVTLAPVDVLADQFFSEHPTSAAITTNPERACVRRLDDLMRAGYLVAATLPDSPAHERGGRTYSLGRLGGELMRVPLDSVAHSRRHHHLQVLRHIELVRANLAAEARWLVDFERIVNERSRRRPDATITTNDGAVIAVEYISSNNSDATIASKANHLASAYSDVRWSANTPATRARVMRITHCDCDVIS